MEDSKTVISVSEHPNTEETIHGQQPLNNNCMHHGETGSSSEKGWFLRHRPVSLPAGN
jgi:hypothetical protein